MKQRRFWLSVAFLLGILAGANLLLLSAFPESRAEILNLVDRWQTSNRPGFVRRVYYDGNGTPHRYVVFVPYQKVANQRSPLLVFLHGYSGNGDDGVQHIHECLGPHIWETRSAFPFVVLFPQSPAGSTWGAEDVAGALTMTLMRQVQSEYGTDADRTYLTGVSSGGNGVWSLAATYPDSFAAVLPISGVPSGSEAARSIADAQLPVWNFFVHGDGDNLETPNQRMQDDLIDAGASPLFTELDGTLSKTWWTHNAWGAAYHNPATFAWLLSQTRSNNSAQRGRMFQRLLVGESVPDAKISAGPEWTFKDSLLSNSGVPPGEDGKGSILTCRTEMRNYELHFEFRFEAGRAFDLLLPSADDGGVFLKIARSHFGSGGVFDLKDGSSLQEADPEAQRGLYGRIWNDVRIRVDGDDVSVVTNGRELNNYNYRSSTSLQLKPEFSIRVQPADTAIQWRNFRIREMTK
jgi:pimeloyl-ACP methyl ester carboxylesterase